VGGEVGLGFFFDGSADAVLLGVAANLQLQNSFTIECWIKRASTAVISQGFSTGPIFGYGHLGYGFGMWDSGKLFLTQWDQSDVTTSAAITDLNYHHVGVTKSGSVVSFYIDGILSGTFGYNPSFSFTSIAAIGARPDNLGNCFYGRIDELSIYSRALSTAEMMSIYNAGVAGKCIAPSAPLIVSQPQNQTSQVGGTASFNVLAAGDSLHYQWRLNGSGLVGATNANLTLYPLQTNQAGSYTVVVSNSVGSVTSGPAILQVNPGCVSAAPDIVAWWPAEGDAKDHAGQSDGSLQGAIAFTQGESGQGFSFNGGAYVGFPATAALDVGASDGFTFECWIMPLTTGSSQVICEWNNGAGSPGVHIDHSNPGIGGPGGILADIIDEGGGSHLFSSQANVLTPGVFQHIALTYSKVDGVAKLYRNGSVVAAQVLGTFRPRTGFPLYLGTRISGPFSGQYYVGVMDEVAVYRRSLTDTEIGAVVNAGSLGKSCSAPQIVAQPQDQWLTPGLDAVLAVAARGNAPLSYQWRYNGMDIDGATNSSLTLKNVQPSLDGAYSAKITNFLGSVTTSNAQLKVQVVLAYGNDLPLTNSTMSFGGPVTIRLENAYGAGDIFYTLDGTAPSFLSAQYTSSFVVTQAVVLRALGYSLDFFESAELDPVSLLIPPVYNLTTSTPGGGFISATPDGGTYLSNTMVRVTATPASGWSFLQWLGDASGTNPNTFVTMTRNKSALAIFGTSLKTTAAGGGSVALNPPGGVYPYGSQVWLSAIPSAGNLFGLWGNGATGNVNPLNIVITNPNPTISSLFGPVSGGQVALTVVPLGGGRVSVNPRSNAYPISMNVSISATPVPGQTFLGWSGGASGTQNPLSISMTTNRTVFANFTHTASLSAGAEYEGLKAEGFVLTLKGDLGGRYEMDGSTNLIVWTPLGLLSNTYGVMQFLDPEATNVSQRYYRAVLLP
jgi:hypothetical protein